MLRLKDLREDADLRQIDVAKKLNCTQTCYSNYELELRDIPTKILKELALFFETSTDYILGLTDIKDPLPRHGQKNVFPTAQKSGDTSANKTSSL